MADPPVKGVRGGAKDATSQGGEEIESLDAEELEEVGQTESSETATSGRLAKPIAAPHRPAPRTRPPAPPRPGTAPPRPPSMTPPKLPTALERIPSPAPAATPAPTPAAPSAPARARRAPALVPARSPVTAAPARTDSGRVHTVAFEQPPKVEIHLAPSESMVAAAERPLATQPGTASAQVLRANATAADLAARVQALRARARPSDKPRLARLLVEQGLAHERAGDLAAAMRVIDEALALDAGQLSAARAARRVGRELPLDKRLSLLDKEAALTTKEGDRADLHVERARLLEAERPDDSTSILAAYRAALALRPTHAEALKGLEGALIRARTKATGDSAKKLDDQLAEHCGHLATSYGGDPELVASYHATRARLLEDRGDDVAAEEAWAAALAADGRVGPTREAYKRHLVRRNAWAKLRDVIAEEAGREHDRARSVRLLYEAARISVDRLGDGEQATALLDHAAARAPTDAAADASVLEELVRRHDARGDARAAAHARTALLAYEDEPAVRALGYRRLAAELEAAGELDGAIAALETARRIDPAHAETRIALDRLYAAGGRDDRRVQLWLDEAAKAREPQRRAAAYVRAAHVAEDALARPDEAMEYLRAAWVTDTGNVDALDELTRLMLPPNEMRHGVGGGEGRGARALIDLFLQAADAAREQPRKIAFLEKVAALFEDALGNPAEAARVYAKILAIEPRRRFALLGMQRAHERSGDFRALAEAIETEAEQAEDATLASSLRLRAAETWRARAGDPDRAIALIRKVLETTPRDPTALLALREAQEAAGRFQEVARTIEETIVTARGADAAPLWIELGEVRKRHLGDVDGAIAAWRAARALDAENPIAVRELAHALRAQGSWRAVAELEESVARQAKDPAVSARAWVRAAEIWEGRLTEAGGDDRAQDAYAKALAARPEDLSAWDGLARLAERRGAYEELEAAFRLRIAREEADGTPRLQLRFALGELLARRGKDPKAAALALDQVLIEAPGHLASLRLLEYLHRRSGNEVALAKVVTAMAQVVRDPLAKRGILWDLVRLQERTDEGVAASPPIAAYLLVYELDQTDEAALGAIVRLAMERLREGQQSADGMPNVRGLLAFALRRMRALSGHPPTQASLALRLADLLEDSVEQAEQVEALALYREALAFDEESPSAVAGMRRTAQHLGDAAAMFLAETRAAELAIDGQAKVRHLLRAAELSPHVPAPEGGAAVAIDLAIRALRESPDAPEAAAATSALLVSQNDRRRLVDVLMDATAAAKRPDRVVALAREGAHHAAAIGNLPVAIALLGKGKAADPRDATLLAELGDLYVQQRAWADAATTYAAAVKVAEQDAIQPILVRGHRALAALCEGPLEDPQRALAELKIVCSLAPDDVDAQRRLATALHARGDAAGALAALEALAASPSLAHAEHVAVLGQIADLRAAAGDLRAADHALRRAVRVEPDPQGAAFARFTAFHERHGGDAALGRALEELAGESGADPRWRLRLGELEVHRLGRPTEGIAHLRDALRAAESGRGAWVPTQLAYAEALLSVGATDDAGRAVRELLQRDPTSASGLDAAQRAFTALGRRDEVQTVEELRAYFGYAGSAAKYRARRSPPTPPRSDALDDVTIQAHVMPTAAKGAAYEIVAILGDQLAKVYPPALSELGVTSRDRHGPRSSHPLRALADRAAQALGVASFELWVHDAPDQRILVENGDPPALVVPRSLETLPELEIAFALGRLLAKVATRTWLCDKLAPEDLEDLLYAAVGPFGGVAPRLRAGEVDELSRRVQKAISRRARRQLEEAAPRLVQVDGARFARSVDQGAIRTAYLLTGDVTSAIDHLRRLDERAMHDLGAETPIGDLVRFALSADASTFRRRLGTTWS
ncbi:MAG: hypothetical protein HYV09_10480 [Deltaproteobacteria bacterium]|nr:hypothetical protein [Deltaproteobacteria bacterium]